MQDYHQHLLHLRFRFACSVDGFCKAAGSVLNEYEEEAIFVICVSNLRSFIGKVA